MEVENNVNVIVNVVSFKKVKNFVTPPNKKHKTLETDILGVYMDFLRSEEIQEIQLDETSVYGLLRIARVFNDYSLIEQIEVYLEKNLSNNTLPILLVELINNHLHWDKDNDDTFEDINRGSKGLLTRIIKMLDEEGEDMVLKLQKFFEDFIPGNGNFSVYKFEFLIYILNKTENPIDENLIMNFFHAFLSNMNHDKLLFKKVMDKYLGNPLSLALTSELQLKLKENLIYKHVITRAELNINPKVVKLEELVNDMETQLRKLEARANQLEKENTILKQNAIENDDYTTQIKSTLGNPIVQLTNYQMISKKTYTPSVNSQPILAMVMLFYDKFKQLAIGAANSISILNYETGALVASIPGHQNFISSLCFYSDEKILYSGSADKSIKVWNLDKSNKFNCASTLLGHRDLISCIVQVKRDVIISGSGDKSIKVWNTRRKECLNTLNGHTFFVSALLDLTNNLAEFDSNYIASCSWDNSIKIWNMTDSKCVETFKEHTSRVLCLLHAKNFNTKIFISGSEDKTIKVWNLSNSKHGSIRTLVGHNGAVYALANLGALNKNLIASSSEDTTIKIWDLNNINCLNTIKTEHETGNKFLLYSSEVNRNLIISGTKDKNLSIWDIVFISD